MTILNPYLSFRGNAREAMTAYQAVFGGELTFMTFGDMGMTEHDGVPLPADGVMHSQLVTAEGFNLMGSDAPGTMGEPKNGSIALSGDDEGLLQGYFDKLADDGSIETPLEKAPWGDWFGACNDRFGINWMVNISGSAQAG